MLITQDGKIPVHWWTQAKNFGDLLSPWLVQKISGRMASYAEQYEQNYTTIGSIIGHTTHNSIVWGTGAFGTEKLNNGNLHRYQRFDPNAKYLAVRGPLTRNLLETNGIKCPRVFGDPALLVSKYHQVKTNQKTHEIGLVLRWSEKNKIKGPLDKNIKLIYLDTDEIEKTIDDFNACKKIMTTSLHGLIIADAYEIPNAWIFSETPKGLEFKYWDYLISTGKTRPPFEIDFEKLHEYSADDFNGMLYFDPRKIDIDLNLLESNCPFIPNKEKDTVVEKLKLKRNWLMLGKRVLY